MAKRKLKKRAAAPVLPQTLYARMEDDGGGMIYPLTFEREIDAIDDNGPTLVGTYRLESARKIAKVVTEKIVEG